MVIVLILGILGSIATIICMAVYIAGHFHSRPQLTVRLADVEGGKSFIYGRKGCLLFAISTRKESNVILTNVHLYITDTAKLEFLPNDLFSVHLSPGNEGVSLCWEGKREVRRKYSWVFAVAYNAVAITENETIPVHIAAEGTVDASAWRFPRSMYTAHSVRQDFHDEVTWQEAPKSGSTGILVLGPGESIGVMGDLATGSVRTGAESFKLKIVQCLDDGQYKIDTVEKPKVGKPS